MLVPMKNEAVFALAEGVATAEEIDTAMRLGANHPMGPLALADLIGLDVCLHVMDVLRTEFADSKYRPCPLLRKMLDAGYLGRKSGRGFFEYGVVIARRRPAVVNASAAPMRSGDTGTRGYRLTW